MKHLFIKMSLIDDIDRAIIKLLQINPRISYSEYSYIDFLLNYMDEYKSF